MRNLYKNALKHNNASNKNNKQMYSNPIIPNHNIVNGN